jgi:hypothetical protein
VRQLRSGEGNGCSTSGRRGEPGSRPAAMIPSTECLLCVRSAVEKKY